MKTNDSYELKICPSCYERPTLSYLGGFYRINGTPSCPVCGNSYTEGHSTEYDMIIGWNRRVFDEDLRLFD